MMLIITCVRGVPGKFDINGAVWCILSVPKLDIFNLKINIYFDDKSTTKILCHFFSKINPDGHFGTKVNTFTFYKGDRRGGGGELIALRSQRYVNKMEALRFLQQISNILDAKIYPVLTWIQIHARGADFFLLNRCNTVHSECSQIRYYQPKNQQF